MDSAQHLIATRVFVGRHTRGYRLSLYRCAFGFGISFSRERKRVQIGPIRAYAIRR